MAQVFFNAASMAVYGPAVERLFTRSGFWRGCAAGGALASLASLACRRRVVFRGGLRLPLRQAARRPRRSRRVGRALEPRQVPIDQPA